MIPTRFFYDCEFHERGPEHPIDLISIGMVGEDGREYYAQHAGFDLDAALEHPWLPNNVLAQLQICGSTLHSGAHTINFVATRYDLLRVDKARHRGQSCDYDGCPWRSRLELVQDLKTFIDTDRYGKPELWGYYADYDHVVFCQLFGSMSDLPAGFPMWTHDIKQWCDALGDPRLPEQDKGEHNALSDAKWNKTAWEFLHRRTVSMLDLSPRASYSGYFPI